MNRTFKMTALACSGLALAMVAQPNDAEAYRRGRVAAGVVTGLVVGGIIAGAAANARASDRVYVTRSGCGEYKRNAIYNEEIGRPSRARYWWDRYSDCRGE